MTAREIKQKEWSKLRLLLSLKSRMIFDICWYTGERIGAVVQLQISDVYLESGNVKELVRFRRKTRKGKDRTRLVAMHEGLKELLKAYEHDPDSPWLFPGATPNKFLSKDSAMDHLQRACQSANLQNITSHSFRRAFANRLHRDGHSTRVVQQCMGHADIRSTVCYIDEDVDAVTAAILSL